MHLQIQRTVWLENVINFRYYILGYTVANQIHKVTSLLLVDQWIYAAGKEFNAAGSRWAYRRNKENVHCPFEGKMLIVH